MFVSHAVFVSLGFIDVAWHVIAVAWVTFAILIAALLVAATDRAIVAAGRAQAIYFDALIGMDRPTALHFRTFVDGRSRNVGIAWLLAVVLGPLGAYAYLGDWGKAFLALVTLNGLGAWWLESWFSIPQIVVIERRTIVASALSQLPFIMKEAQFTPARTVLG